MCGIIGSINFDNKELFQHSLEVLNHRGPDNKSIYEYKNILSLEEVFFPQHIFL